MPTTPMKDLLYRCAMPVLAPSPRGQMKHNVAGHAIQTLSEYEHALRKHHVLGASLLLSDGADEAQLYTSIKQPLCSVGADSIFRVASITKMATALVTLRLVEEGAFSLDTPVMQLLPDADALDSLRGVTVRQLLSHTSGLSDVAAVDQALRDGGAFHDVLRTNGIRFAAPGNAFRYCNFGFGLMGCVLENITGKQLNELFTEQLFVPLGLDAAMDATTIEESRIVPINRVLPYHAGQAVTITPLGRKKLVSPDPVHHFGHTAGSLYTNAASLSRLLKMIHEGGVLDGKRFLQANMIAEMTREHASYGQLSPGMGYGLGLVLLQMDELSEHRIIGHQGYAYGCADGAFIEEGTGRQMIFLNGGCSEARRGRLGVCNYDLLKWSLRKELPAWK